MIQDLASLIDKADVAKIRALAGNKPSGALDVSDLSRITELLDQLKILEDTSGFHKWFQVGTPFDIENLPKHKAFFEATNKYRETWLLGGNRCGKTRSGAMSLAVWATGQYPDWWTGKRFKGPVSLWGIGKTGQTTRDTVQEALLGPLGAWGTGAIPADCLGDTSARAGMPGAVDTVYVKHVSGGWSTIGFKSFDQKPEAFYGTAKHAAWLDEPCPELVYHECLVRTLTTNGKIIHTITPKEGLTRLIAEFLSKCDLLAGAERIKGLDAMIAIAEMDKADVDEYERLVGTEKPVEVVSKACVTIGMSDCPWLDQDAVAQILQGTPPHLREAVKNGTPSIGSGAIYPIPLDDVVISQVEAEKLKPFPAHWKYLYGMDVGWNKTAVVVVALDVDTGVYYVVDEYVQGKLEPEIHAARIKARWDWCRGAIDPAARSRSQSDGKQLLRIYKQLGLKVTDADNSVEAGINRVWSLLSTGRLKFLPHTFNLQKEYTLYRRDDNGRIVKDHDHAMDALRYAINTFHLATPMPIKELVPKAPQGRRYNV